MYIFSQNNVKRAKLTRSEYAVIHSDFKGKIDGKPSILAGAEECGSQILMVDILTQKKCTKTTTKLRADKFIGELQFRCLKGLLKSDERAFFIEQVDRLYSTVEVMPKTLEQDGKGDNAIAYFHYFTANTDFYITEKDVEDGITQAFGLVSFVGDYPEVGYISIEEVIRAGVEIDLYFEPKTLGEIKA